MFARVKKSGRNQYLELVENRKEKGKVKQRVIATVGRMDQLKEKGRIETLIHSLSRFSEKGLLVLSSQSNLAVEAKTMGPPLIFAGKIFQAVGVALPPRFVRWNDRLKFRMVVATAFLRLIAT
jgi:hypothetical protein